MTDLTHLTAEQLSALITQAEARKAELRDQGKITLREKWETEAKAHGLTVEEVLGVKAEPVKRRKRGSAGAAEAKGEDRRKIPAPIKFLGPNGESWTGRGVLATWLKKIEDEGGSREDWRVKEPETG